MLQQLKEKMENARVKGDRTVQALIEHYQMLAGRR